MKSQIHHEIDLTENELINLPAKLLEHSQIRPHDVAMRHKRFGIWKEFTWEEYLNKVRSASLGFYELGVREGDKVAIHSEYRHCLLYTSPSPRDRQKSRMPSSA